MLSDSKLGKSEAATERCSVKKVFSFARSPYCEHWLTCSGRRLFSQETVFPPVYFTSDKNKFILPGTRAF